ncbi:DUF5686 and carboxypeptidase-like regulatory domain-containing protein [Cyclobacterium qasimii]|uniref:TonB-dependent receptor n=1 Tax=Cyclobacterium qasimii M12-11B TaxID=641524 RepID=S7WMI1_9BACT|nr:DUF5686 and carboxypeptidase-like regulatory domain-containing protein [Cyclobacterium qasimii]EPR67944.1 TonB-dependent receptor [Cyclobacterium qasimii M12-11B]
MKTKYLLLILSILLSVSTYGQVVINGKVTDAETGDPIPFASVILQGTSTGNSTDFEGNFTITSNSKADSIEATYIGYIPQTKAIGNEKELTVNFQLRPSDIQMEAFVFEAGENPAFEIIRKAVDKKKQFDKRNLEAYETKNYTKIEIDIDHVSEAFTKRKAVQKVTAVLDSIKQLTNDEGEKILPVFFSETLSSFYFRNNPELKKEVVEKSKVTGVGITDGSTASQITGSAFQEYNFYRNWLVILEKEFVSPIADGWRGFYDYDLLDSVKIGEDSVYALQVYPLREQDLAFSGTIWINKDTYALKQVDLTIPKEANLNFIERIKIQQELTPTQQGALIPSKTRVQVKIGQITPKTAGLLAKFYTAVDSISTGDPKPTSFFNQAVVLKPDFDIVGEDFWNQNRKDPLSNEELAVLQMVDTLKKIPVVRFYSEGLKFLASGYLPIGKLDLGPWPGFFNYNNVEGIRLGAGLRTNSKFSKKWTLMGYAAYGFLDQRWKYEGGITRILDRNRWTTIKLSTQKEIDQVGLEMENLEGNSIFMAASRFGTLRRPFISTNHRLDLKRELFKGLTLYGGLKSNHFDPLYNYYHRDNEGDSELKTEFRTTEAKVGLRYGRDETFIINDNERISLGPSRWPIFALNYAQGFKWLKGEYNYSKLNLSISQKLNMGMLGISRYEAEAGKVFGEVPYPILENHLGNETLFYTSAAFNTMNFNEFASDQYFSIRYRHFFEGFLLNKIPLIRKLKWRAVANANVLFGSASEANKSHAPLIDPEGFALQPFGSLDSTKPYLELGYGVENIFKFFRVDFFHRMTYLDDPETKPFAVKVSAQIIF